MRKEDLSPTAHHAPCTVIPIPERVVLDAQRGAIEAQGGGGVFGYEQSRTGGGGSYMGADAYMGRFAMVMDAEMLGTALAKGEGCGDMRQSGRAIAWAADVVNRMAESWRRSPTLRQELVTKLQAVLRVRAHTAKKQKTNQNYLCQVCSYHPWPKERKPVSENKPGWAPESLVTEERNLKLANTQEFRRIIIPILQWDDIPDMHNMCTCGGFDTRCEAEPHLVRVERLPTKSEWAGLVLQPRGIPLQVRLNRDVMLEAISPYLTSLVDNVHIPFYVVDEVREFTTGDNEIPSSS
ncbi:hypothetical protein BGX38DRAFT_1276322 [Terfezia claveryi]|nr:hypothetical protein BGX38DRAFT_1276322 [Terfezia claveryi]